MSFANILKRVREAKGLAKKELSRRLGHDINFIFKIEHRRRRTTVEEFVAICRALDVSPHKLLRMMMDEVDP